MASLPAGRKVELRPLKEADAEALYAAIEASRAHLKRRLRWPASVGSAENCRDFIRESLRAAERREKLVYGVFELKAGALAGVAALQNLNLTPGLGELAFWISAEKSRKGYAFEAAKSLAAAALKGGGFDRLYARIDPANRPARRVIQKLGFRYEGRLRHEKRVNGRWVDQECWGLLKKEWKKSKA